MFTKCCRPATFVAPRQLLRPAPFDRRRTSLPLRTYFRDGMSRCSSREWCHRMTKTDLSGIYRNYIACLNAQDWPKLGEFVGEDVHYNGRHVGLAGYRAMLQENFR